MAPRRRFAEHHSGPYQRARRQLLGQPCWHCGQPATTAEHRPPLAVWYHPGQTLPWTGELLPSCRSCQYLDGGWRLANRLRNGTEPPPTRSAIWK